MCGTNDIDQFHHDDSHKNGQRGITHTEKNLFWWQHPNSSCTNSSKVNTEWQLTPNSKFRKVHTDTINQYQIYRIVSMESVCPTCTCCPPSNSYPTAPQLCTLLCIWRNKGITILVNLGLLAPYFAYVRKHREAGGLALAMPFMYFGRSESWWDQEHCFQHHSQLDGSVRTHILSHR